MWAQLVAAAAGIALMAVPSLVGYEGAAADIDHIIGPLAASIGIMSASQILRGLRWVNLGLAIILLASIPFVSRPGSGILAALVVGAILAATATVKGEVEDSYGAGWRALWTK